MGRATHSGSYNEAGNPVSQDVVENPAAEEVTEPAQTDEETATPAETAEDTDTDTDTDTDAETYEDYTADELRAELKERGLPTSGKVADLRERLIQDDAGEE